MKISLYILCACVAALIAMPTTAATAAGTIDIAATGQTACYDDTGASVTCADTGQDGDLLAGIRWPNPRFTDNSDDTVTDNLTGLMWLKNASCLNTQYTESDGGNDGFVYWPTALAYVIGINDNTYPNCQAGHMDWRLPNVNELKSLVDYDQSSLALPASHPFTNTKTSYWSSTTHSNTRANAFGVSMDEGRVITGTKTGGSLMAAWPVRDSGTAGSIALPKTGQATCYDAAGTVIACATTGQDAEYTKGVAWPVPRFTDNGDGTVTDELTGIIWLADVTDCMSGTGDWQNALDTVADLNANPATYHAIGACSYTGSHNDWRLANIRELESIVHYDFAEEGAYADTSAWLDALGVGFEAVGLQHWSSTSYDGSPDDAYVYNMSALGTSVIFDKGSTPYYIWPVRGGVYGDPDIGVTPTTIDFGAVTIGSFADQDITITNEGTYYLALSTIAQPAAPFSITDDGCSALDLYPGDSCIVSVRYEPTAEGAGNDSIVVPSDDPDEATVTVSLAGTGTAAATDPTNPPNNPPAAFDLVYPADGATGVVTPVTMIWKKTTDPDGDPVSYDINYCTDAAFAGCDPMLSIASAAKHTLTSRVMMLARSWGTSLIAGPLSLMGCGGGSETTTTDTTVTPSVGVDELPYAATDLQLGTTYYWKVIANDTNGGTTESAVWSFTTE